MNRVFRMAYIDSVRERYFQATKMEKGRILDELHKTCRLNRHYAGWKIRQGHYERDAAKKKRHKACLYSPRLLEVIRKVWKAAGFPWSVRLKEILLLWKPWIDNYFRLSPEEDHRLLQISPRTIDRALRETKIRNRRRIYGRTKPGTLLRHQIPIRTEFREVRNPGWLESDLVSHSGPCAAGEFIYSLNLTDIVSVWTETRAMMGKHEQKVLDRLEEIRRGFPFDLRGLDADNGSEFINDKVFKYCRARDIEFTRSRPYKKDDNAHVEQKNWTHVRKLLGWDRYDTEEALRAINDLYANELRLYLNLFQPSVKLIKVVRRGSRLQRLYDRPQTPLDRLVALAKTSPTIHPDKIEALLALRSQLDPFALSRIIETKLAKIWKLAHPRPEQPPKKSDPLAGVSSAEKQVLRAIAAVQGFRAFIRPKKNAPIVEIRHG